MTPSCSTCVASLNLRVTGFDGNDVASAQSSAALIVSTSGRIVPSPYRFPKRPSSLVGEARQTVAGQVARLAPLPQFADIDRYRPEALFIPAQSASRNRRCLLGISLHGGVVSPHASVHRSSRSCRRPRADRRRRRRPVRSCGAAAGARRNQRRCAPRRRPRLWSSCSGQWAARSSAATWTTSRR